MTCWFFGHALLLRQKRDDNGKAVKPHAITWECSKCGKDLGETALTPQWSLLARMRRQRTKAQIAERKSA